MDRGHRPLLSLPRWLAGGVVLLTLAGNAPAQQPATPAVTATPWVQASPPPGMATPTPAPRPADVSPSPRPPRPPKPASSPAATPSPEDVAREMMRRREEEQRAAEKKDAARADKPEGKAGVRLDQLPPDERAAYQRNLPLWQRLPEEEREELRRAADERAKQETNKAYQESGLNLDHDQREVFDLRYRQERRKLERELQEKANAERTRRLVEISARLKQEFAGKSMPGATATPAPAIPATPAPKKAEPKPAATPNPDTLTTPGPVR